MPSPIASGRAFGPSPISLTLATLAAALALTGCGEPAESVFDPPTPGEVDNPFDGIERRQLPPVSTAEIPPPPIGASTLAIAADRAVVSDADRRRVIVVDLTDERVVATHAVDGTPGRIAVHGDRAFVALRDAGGIAVLDLGDGALTETWSVCPSPRGLDADPDGQLVVACLGGRLMKLGVDGRLVAERWLRTDLRDVAFDRADGTLWVSRFRSASVLHLGDFDATPDVYTLGSAASALDFHSAGATSGWRMRAMPDGGALMVHVIATDQTVGTRSPGGYGGGGGCTPPIARTGLSTVDSSSGVVAGEAQGAVLAVDAVPVGGDVFHLAAPGNRTLRPTAVVSDQGRFDSCREAETTAAVGDDEGALQYVAVDVDRGGDTWAFSREPAILAGPDGARIDLGGISVFDSGHDLFHVDGGGGIACASCHPEGGDDGHTWVFSDTGARRTQELRGGIAGTEPFHWEGDMSDFAVLAGEVFARRMSGPMVTRPLAEAWLRWIDSVPLPQGDLGVDPVAAERGRAIYEDPVVGCASCHGGARLADDGTHDVGTGLALQTPTLRGIGLRGPFMHDGCAPTLADRFSPTDCGGSDHGQISALEPGAVADLVEYLNTL